jgi:hypothetical protein
MARSGRRDGQPLRDGYGRAVLTPGLAARWYRWFPAGRPKLMAGRLRLMVSSPLPADGRLCRRAS